MPRECWLHSVTLQEAGLRVVLRGTTRRTGTSDNSQAWAGCQGHALRLNTKQQTPSLAGRMVELVGRAKILTPHEKSLDRMGHGDLPRNRAPGSNLCRGTCGWSGPLFGFGASDKMLPGRGPGLA